MTDRILELINQMCRSKSYKVIINNDDIWREVRGNDGFLILERKSGFRRIIIEQEFKVAT